MRISAWIIIAATLSMAASSTGWSDPISVQLSKGGAQYASTCARCHGPALGGAWGPPLKGETFLQEWNQQTARKLYSRILTTMPASAPGTLSPRTVLNLTLYILSQNGVRLGSKERTSPNQLNAVTIGR